MYNEGTDMSKASIGELRDIIKDANTGEIIEVHEWEKNIIVKDIGILVACLMKGHPGYSGMLYWAVGSGLGTWDNMNPPLPSADDHKLVNEIGRKAIPSASISFVDANGNVSASPTNRLLITLSFGENDCNGEWREMMIVGGNATSTKDSGVAINHKTHQFIGKTTNVTVDRQIRFTFN